MDNNKRFILTMRIEILVVVIFSAICCFVLLIWIYCNYKENHCRELALGSSKKWENKMHQMCKYY